MEYRDLIEKTFNFKIAEGFPLKEQALLASFESDLRSNQCIDSLRYQYKTLQESSKSAGLALTKGIKRWYSSHNVSLPDTPSLWVASAYVYLLTEEADHIIRERLEYPERTHFDFKMDHCLGDLVDEFGIYEKHSIVEDFDPWMWEEAK